MIFQQKNLHVSLGLAAIVAVCILGRLMTPSAEAAVDLITVVHPDGSSSVYGSALDTDASRGEKLLEVAEAAEDGDALYLSAATFDIGSSGINLEKNPRQAIVPEFHYGSGPQYGYVAQGTSYQYKIYALVSDEWVLSYYSEPIADAGDDSNFYITVAWNGIRGATRYRADVYSENEGRWQWYYDTSATSFNDGDGTEDDFYEHDIQMPFSGSIDIHGAGKDETVIKSSVDSAYIVQLASGSETTDLSIIDNGAYGTYRYLYGTPHGFTGSLIKNVRLVGQSDGIFVANEQLPSESYLLVDNVDVRTDYDVFNWFSAGRVYVRDSSIVSVSVPGKFDPANSARGVSADNGGNITLYNTEINVSGSEVKNVGIISHAGNAGGSISMFRGSIQTSDTNPLDMDISGGTMDVAADVSYDPEKTVGAIHEVDPAIPEVSGVADDLIPRRTKTWIWSSGERYDTFRYLIDQNIDGEPTGEYSDVTSATQSFGDGIYYLHIQARSLIGYEGPVVTVMTILDRKRFPSGGVADKKEPVTDPMSPLPVPVPAVDNKGCDASGSYQTNITCEAESMPSYGSAALDLFVANGTPLTFKLGRGERAGIIKSYTATFGHPPMTVADWSDVIRISTGRWPEQRSAIAEERAYLLFGRVYARSPDRNEASDDAAVIMMAYGLRPTQRNLNSEYSALQIYEAIFRQLPSTSISWDLVRAIAYSGAERS